MCSTFWTNTIWFILLFVTSIIVIVLTLRKTNNIRFTVAFLFSIIGLMFILEAILAIVLNAYTYFPKIVSDRFLDAVFGNYFSQISVSSTALFIAVYNLSYIWYCIFAFVYFLTDMLFVKLGVYEHFWYKSIYTFFGFIPFFWFINKWHDKAKYSTNRFINYVSLYLSVASFSTFAIFLGIRLVGIQMLKGHLFADPAKDNTSTGFFYQAIVLNYLIILHRSKLHWLAKTTSISFLFFAQYLAYRADLIFIPKGLFFKVTSLDLIGSYFLIAVFNYLLSFKPRTVRKQ